MAMIRPLGKEWACVTIEKIVGRKHNQYKVLKGMDYIGVLDASTKIIEFEGNVFDNEGNELHAEGKFYITAETIDPYHLLVDLF